MQGGRGRKRPWEPAAGCLRVPVASPSQARTGHAERGDTRARQSPDSPGAPGRFEGLEIGIRQDYRRRPHPGRRLAPGTVPWATSPGTPRRPSRSARWASCVNSLVGWSTSPPAPSPLLPWRGRRGVRAVHWLHKPYPAYTLCPGTCSRAWSPPRCDRRSGPRRSRSGWSGPARRTHRDPARPDPRAHALRAW